MHELTSLKMKTALGEVETLRHAQGETQGALSHDQAAELVRKCQELDRRWQASRANLR